LFQYTVFIEQCNFFIILFICFSIAITPIWIYFIALLCAINLQTNEFIVFNYFGFILFKLKRKKKRERGATGNCEMYTFANGTLTEFSSPRISYLAILCLRFNATQLSPKKLSRPVSFPTSFARTKLTLLSRFPTISSRRFSCRSFTIGLLWTASYNHAMRLRKEARLVYDMKIEK